MSRRQMLAAAAVIAVTPTAALAADKNHGSYSVTADLFHRQDFSSMIADDPVFAAIERHRQAAHALSAAYHLPDAILDQRQRAEEDALLAWLTTVPITMAGVIATLEHASHRPYDSDYPYDYVYPNLAESTQYCCDDADDPNDILKAGEQFPAMIATALQKIAGS
jgi:hypothetical protein